MSNIPERFLVLARDTAAPLDLFGIVQAEVQPGQVWRAKWGEVSILVLVVGEEIAENHGVFVPIVPITLDPHAEVEGSIILSVDSNMFGVEATLWCPLLTSIPLRTLDLCFGELDGGFVIYCQGISRGQAIEFPSGCRVGEPIDSIFSEDAEIEALLKDDLDELKQTQGLSIMEEGMRSQVVSRLKNLKLGEVITKLGVTQPIAMDAMGAKAQLTSEQISILAGLANLNSDELAQVFRGVSSPVVFMVEHPMWRNKFEDLSRRTGSGLSDLRDAAAHEIDAIAARESKPEINFDDRLTRWFETRTRDVHSGHQ